MQLERYWLTLRERACCPKMCGEIGANCISNIPKFGPISAHLGTFAFARRCLKTALERRLFLFRIGLFSQAV